MDLKDIETEARVRELSRRGNVRSISVKKDETHRLRVFGEGERYIRGEGPLTILEIKEDINAF